MALGNLQHQPRPIGHGTLQRLQLAQEAAPAQVQRRRVDGHMQRRRRAHAIHVFHHAAQHELRDVVDQRRRLHRLDERRWRDAAPARMLPAQQRLGADPAARPYLDDGLVDHLEFAALQRQAHVLQQQPARRRHDQEHGDRQQPRQQANGAVEHVVLAPDGLDVAGGRLHMHRQRPGLRLRVHAARDVDRPGREPAIVMDRGPADAQDHGRRAEAKPLHQRIHHVAPFDQQEHAGIGPVAGRQEHGHRRRVLAKRRALGEHQPMRHPRLEIREVVAQRHAHRPARGRAVDHAVLGQPHRAHVRNEAVGGAERQFNVVARPRAKRRHMLAALRLDRIQHARQRCHDLGTDTGLALPDDVIHLAPAQPERHRDKAQTGKHPGQQRERRNRPSSKALAPKVRSQKSPRCRLARCAILRRSGV